MKRTNMRHRALAMLLLLAMTLTALPLSAWAEELNGEQTFGTGGGTPLTQGSGEGTPEPSEGSATDTSQLIEDISITMNGKDPSIAGAERDSSEYQPYNRNLTMKITLKYDPRKHGVLKKGDQLKVQLAPIEPENASGGHSDYIELYANNGPFMGVVDETGDQKKIGELKFGSTTLYLNFEDFNEPFNATISLPYSKTRDSDIENYFAREENKNKTKLDFTVELQVNEQGKDRFIKLSVPKATAQAPTEASFSKYGKYDQEDNHFLYNVGGATKLRRTNEVLIYDTPDINLRFNSDLKFYVRKSATDNGGENFIYSIPSSPTPYYNMSKRGNYQEATDPTKADAEDCQMWLYDLYYLVDTVDDSTTAVPMAEYEEQTIELTHPLLSEDQKQSIVSVSQPKHILFWVPTGQKLSAEQQERIDNAGGLNKKVGKGFFIRAYNLQFPESGNIGTYFKIIYDMEIANPSQVKNDKNDPLYFNSLSYYIQEIPNCPDGATCTPIDVERSKSDESARNAKLNVHYPLVYSSYDAEISPYKPIRIAKVDQNNKPVKGAEFTIYRLNDDGTQGEIAKNNLNQKMTNLITDKDGKLVDRETGSAARVYLEKGKYQLVETVVPKGYTADNTTTDFKVEKGAVDLKIENTNQNPGETTEPSDDKMDIIVSKKWLDKDGQPLTNPPSEAVKVALYRDGQKTAQTIELSGSNDWKNTFKDLPKKSDNNQEYKYTVKELDDQSNPLEAGNTFHLQDWDFVVSYKDFEITNKVKSDEGGGPNPPITPDQPDTPQKPDQPNKPDEPKKPDKPQEPEQPSKPTPAKPLTPEMIDKILKDFRKAVPVIPRAGVGR